MKTKLTGLNYTNQTKRKEAKRKHKNKTHSFQISFPQLIALT